MPHCILGVRFTDEKLLWQTFEEYYAAIENGDMTEAETIEQITALALGMFTVEIKNSID